MKTSFFLNAKGALSLLICIISFGVFGQFKKTVSYSVSEVPKSTVLSLGNLQINAVNAKYFLIDVNSLREQMQGVMHRDNQSVGFEAELAFPHPD
ncbi:MAG: hypothetical protein ACK46O_04070, partial [Flavobacteriia bacterium]